MVSFKHPALLLFNPEHFFLFLACPLCSLNLYLLWSASHTVCDSLFSQTPVAFAQGVMSYDPSVCTCMSQQGYFAIYTYEYVARQVQTLNLFLSVRSHIFSANISLYVCIFFSLSHAYLKSAVMHSEYRTPFSHLICSQGDIRNEKIAKIVSLLPSSAAGSLRSDWKPCTGISHVSVTAVGEGLMRH